MWIGATVATNNTGELMGIYVALQTAQAHAEPPATHTSDF